VSALTEVIGPSDRRPSDRRPSDRRRPAVTVDPGAVTAPDGAGRTPGSQGRSRRARWHRAVSPVAIVGLWVLLSETGVISSSKLPPAWTVAKTAWQLTSSGVLETNLLASLERVVIGLAIGVTVGVTLALVSGLSRLGEVTVDPPLQALKALPILAALPLIIVWFGIGQTSKLVIIASAVSFPIYVNLVAGIRGIDPKLLEAAKTLDLSRYQTIRNIVLPGAADSFLVGLRFATATAWLVLVVSEQINATSGIGYLMENAEDYFRIDIIIVGLFVYALLGIGSDALVRAGERRYLRWRSA
jgi:sulfonate transport system permease protein